MKTVFVALGVVVLVAVVGVGAFFAGENYGLTQAQNIRAEFFAGRAGQGLPGDAQNSPLGARGQGGQGAQGGQFGRAAATGTVKSVQGNTVEVTQRDGSAVTVTLEPQTVIQKTVNGTAADIQPGTNVTVLSNQTGSKITAQSVQIRAGGQ